MRLYNQGIRTPRLLTVFTPEEDALLGTDFDSVIAKQIGTTTSAVSNRRRRLGIHAYAPKGRPRSRCKRGYQQVQLEHDDPLFTMARSDGSVQEHRIVMARHLGRPLARDEFVHHRNGIRHDNRLANLELWTRSHPDGQRVEDVLEWCIEFIERYAQTSVFTGENPI